MLYNNVKKLCEENKVTVSQLERDLEFPRSSVCKWNENEPGITKVRKVADYFKVPIERILDDDKETVN